MATPRTDSKRKSTTARPTTAKEGAKAEGTSSGRGKAGRMDHHYLDQKQFATVEESLQRNLSTMIGLYLKSKKFHWDVRGRFFEELHTLFDAVAETAIASVDELAERLVQLGGSPDATPERIARESAAKVPAGEEHNPRPMLEALVDDLSTIGRSLRDDSQEVDEAGDPATADMYNGFILDLDKHRWMLQAHLDDDKMD